MSNREGGTVTNSDAGGSVNWSGGDKVTGLRGHVGGGTGVHEPVTTTTISMRRWSRVERSQKSRIPRLGGRGSDEAAVRRHRGRQSVADASRLRRGEEGLVAGRGAGPRIPRVGARGTGMW